MTPLGATAGATWRKLIGGDSAIGAFGAGRSAGQVARCGLPSLDSAALGTHTPDFVAFALHAAREAAADAGGVYGRDSGAAIGVGMGDIAGIVEAGGWVGSGRTRKVSPYFVPRILPNAAAGVVGLELGLQGPSLAPANACAAGACAVGEGFRIVERGDADVMVCGGSEAVICDVAVEGFARARALGEFCCPFDVRRRGFVMGEGAGILVLESLESALRRGVTEVYAEVVGYGMSGDAFHVTSPCPEGSGAFRAMKAALGGRDVQDVDYINAHATSTPVGDAVERLAIARLLDVAVAGSGAVVSSTKGATGHLLGAAGAIEAAFCAMAVAEGVVPPTVNLESVDDVSEVQRLGWGSVQRYVPKVALEKHVNVALSNSFGFGGTNASLVFAAPPEGLTRKRVAAASASPLTRSAQRNAHWHAL